MRITQKFHPCMGNLLSLARVCLCPFSYLCKLAFPMFAKTLFRSAGRRLVILDSSIFNQHGRTFPQFRVRQRSLQLHHS